MKICRFTLVLALTLVIFPEALAYAQPATDTTVTTTAPTTISIGTLAGQVLQWVVALAVVPIAGYFTLILKRLADRTGIAVTDDLRQRLMTMIVNGIHLAADQLQSAIQGRGQVEIKNAVTARVIQYVQEHGAETLKGLGLSPGTQAAKEVIEARVARALSDPAISTPPSVTPPEGVSPKAPELVKVT